MSVASRFYKGYVDTPEGQIHYRTVGTGLPLIMLHQNPSSSLMWEAVMPGLAECGIQAIAFDTPGYGHSDPPPSQPSIAYYARRIAEACEILDIDGYSVLGHHTGALIGAYLAVNYPDRVLSYIPVGYPILPEKSLEGLSQVPVLHYQADGSDLPTLWAGIARLGGPQMTGDIGMRCLLEKIQGWHNWGWAYRAVSKVQAAELAKRIPCPTLLLSGKDDPIIAGTHQAKDLIPNNRVAIIDGGVNVPDDNPEGFVQAVDSFLKSFG